MRAGKLSESTLKRFVLGQIKNKRTEVIKGAGVGEDCAFLTLAKDESQAKDALITLPEDNVMAFSLETVTLPVKNAPYLAIMAAANNLAASGAIPIAVMLSVTLPVETKEEQLRALTDEAERCCQELNIQIAGGHTEVSPGVTCPVITAAVTGKVFNSTGEKGSVCSCIRESERLQEFFSRKAGTKELDIVMSKWIGLEGTYILAEEKEKELLKRYPAKLIASAKEQGKWLSVAAEAEVALKQGVYLMHDVRNGGVFGALWELSQKTGLGFCVDLKKIPVKQETIEVCEFFGLNPYEFMSGGALLMMTEDGAGLVEALADEGISSAVIGSANSGNDKMIRNGEEKRYLGHPQPDEIFKITF